MPPRISGIIGLVGAILSLPFYAFFLIAFGAAGLMGGGLGLLFGSLFGIPAILQIVYFFKVQRIYSQDTLVSNYVKGNLQQSAALRAIGWICAIACTGWTLVTLVVGVMEAPFVFISIPFMVASGHFNFHSLLVASKQPGTVAEEI